MSLNSWLIDLFGLLFPDLCAACGQPLVRGEKVICMGCHYNLPRTDFHLFEDNPVSRIFYGRVHLEAATSYLFFNKGGKVQHLMHQLKYKKNKEVGTYIGKLLGHDLKKDGLFQHTQVVVPVPLHPKKQRIRGYNQSEQIAIGLAEAMQISYSTNNLIRNTFTETQTKKSRYSRWENVSGKFSVIHPEKLEGKNVLLVDDVLTTGATLEACAQELIKVKGIKVSVATLAYAQA
ncbi:MAG: ComF family protein [Bacteroidales bacterium]|jgi:ComF family protein|nr:ComF family protein [Bacteroidota bacterium]MCF8348145.1 ComF family protein [Bacteroidales bacterium]